MTTQKKTFMGEVQLKEVTDTTPEGSFSAVFSRFNVIDHDGDVTLPKAFTEGQKVPIAGVGHNWDIPVIGVGIVHQDSEKAWIDGLFNLKTQGGREHYESVKFSHEHGVNQEYSYAYDVTKKARPDELVSWPGAKRGLTGLHVKEVSPVLLGAGIGTGTLNVKRRKDRTIEAMNQQWPEHENASCPICNEALSAHGVGMLALHKELFASRIKGRKQMSYEDRRSAVQDAIRKQDKIDDITETGEDDYTTPWITDTTDEFVIVQDDEGDGYLMISYIIGADGSVVLGDAVPVEQSWTPKSGALSEMKYADHALQVLAAVKGLNDRSKALAALRAQSKAGRSISAPNRQKLGEISAAARAAAAELDKLLTTADSPQTDPKGRKMASKLTELKLAQARLSMASISTHSIPNEVKGATS